MIGILSQHDDNRTAVGCGDGSGVNDSEICHLMIVNAGNVDFTMVLEDDASVIADNATISSPINEGSALVLAGMLGNVVLHLGGGC